MTSHFVSLNRRIYKDLVNIEQAVVRSQAAWRKYVDTEDDFLLDSVALNLHGFYNGIEKLLERIAKGLDNKLPGGKDWHKALLEQMATEVTGVRPIVVSETLRIQLDEYRRFRHVVRSVYSYDLEPEKLRVLVKDSFATFAQVEKEFILFARWLADIG